MVTVNFLKKDNYYASYGAQCLKYQSRCASMLVTNEAYKMSYITSLSMLGISGAQFQSKNKTRSCYQLKLGPYLTAWCVSLPSFSNDNFQHR